MKEIVADLSPDSLATAVKGNLYALFRAIATSASAPMQLRHDGYSWRTGVAHPWFNGALSTLPPDAQAGRAIQETVDSFQAQGVTSFTWWLAPDLESTLWPQQLVNHGFQHDSHTPGMAIQLALLHHTRKPALVIQHVEDSPMLAEWTRILIQGFEMPEEMAPAFMAMLERLGIHLPFRNYLGFLDGKPVASATLFLGAGVAGIYNVATLPEARGRGIGSEITLVPLLEARDIGYQVGVLQSSDMGYGVYRRMGFEKVCQMDHYYWQASSS